jgi:nucleotide-binding universal stress UspA family protein
MTTESTPSSLSEVPARAQVPALSRIVVGIDGSADALRAAAFAAGLAARLGAEVIGVHAMGLLEAWGDDESTADKHLPEARERARASMEGPWRQPFIDHGVAHRVELRDGNPVHVLLTAAEELHADLIVVGSRGAGELAERLMGSTSTQITERSAIPVVVVPGPHPGRMRGMPSPD